MRTRLLFCSVLVASGALVFACGGKKPPPKEPTITEVVSDAGADDAAAEPPKPKSLYDRLGGKENIGKVVELFIKNLTGNEVTKKRFAKLSKEKIEKFRTNLIDQICKESGGDCTYAGKDMKTVHKGMKITDAEWSATIGALNAALEESKVGKEEANDLVALIAPMREDIVEVKDKPKPAPKK